ncbi:uncharacterized protein LOC131168407 [Malania oleifera]|uniref:uncharacterized protein LOC131168407 n=1 Tax=Malania oleifera TaxID=397392 RepID=UPI0025AE7724|nr:uncharacterized protein LOC131168407 [Malania oleifera]
MNGVVEAANKNMKSILENMTKTFRDWHDKLLFTLLAYRTIVQTSTGATPYSLVYEMKAVILIEVEIPSLWDLKEAKLTEVEWIQSMYNQLNLIKEKRMAAIAHGQLYQRRMMRAFNKKAATGLVWGFRGAEKGLRSSAAVWLCWYGPRVAGEGRKTVGCLWSLGRWLEQRV